MVRTDASRMFSSIRGKTAPCTHQLQSQRMAKYSGEEEFYVTVREKGEIKQSQEDELRSTTTGPAQDPHVGNFMSFSLVLGCAAM